MAKPTRMFMYQRREFKSVKRVPTKVHNLRWRLRLGSEYAAWEWSWHHYKFLPHKNEPDRVTALREVVHCSPGQARAWGDVPPSEVLRDILARARCGLYRQACTFSGGKTFCVAHKENEHGTA